MLPSLNSNPSFFKIFEIGAELSNMIWKVDELISYLSKFITLKAGDIIFTGTPSGVGKLNINDKVEAEIENVGTLAFELIK